MLIIGSKSWWERHGVDIIISLKDKVVHGATEERIPPTGIVEAVIATMKDRVSQPGQKW